MSAIMEEVGHEGFWSFLDSASVSIHLVGPDGTILFANKKELESLGYTAKEYVGHNITEFHKDAAVISDILTKLTEGKTLLSYVARLKKKDDSIMYASINSNVYRKADEFIHTRCFTSVIDEETWKTLKGMD